MKLDLKMRMGQQLVMTPQLHMAIRMLQMSTIELEAHIQEELERNPLLEKTESQEQNAESDTSGHDALKNDLPLDTSWSDVYGDAPGSFRGLSASRSSSTHQESTSTILESTLTQQESLTDHLIWQLGLSALHEKERHLGSIIIGAIDDNGYLTQDLESLKITTNASLDELEDTLVLIQSFDPPGVGARNLSECLLLQLKRTGTARSPVTQLLHHLDDLARRDFKKLTRILRLSEQELSDAVAVIHSLNPKPGLLYGSDHAPYIIPDAFVHKKQGVWVVEINGDVSPAITINERYRNMAKQKRQPSEDRRFIVENTQSAQWLIKSMAQRSQTIHRVAKSIVRFQTPFLDAGPEHLKPLTLSNVADDIEMHESTISRVVRGKYLHTPRGVFEFKRFFSSALDDDSGQARSASSIQYKIRKLIEEESPTRPYSDEKLSLILKEEGINVARRTIAKYRESMAIPSSSRRKRLA